MEELIKSGCTLWHLIAWLALSGAIYAGARCSLLKLLQRYRSQRKTLYNTARALSATLTAMNGEVEALQQELEEKEREAEALAAASQPAEEPPLDKSRLKLLRHHIESLLEQTADALNLADWLHDGRLPAHRKIPLCRCRLRSFVDHALVPCRHPARDRGIALDSSAIEPTQEVWINADIVRAILHHSVGKQMALLREGDTIAISSDTAPGRWSLEVCGRFATQRDTERYSRLVSSSLLEYTDDLRMMLLKMYAKKQGGTLLVRYSPHEVLFRFLFPRRHPRFSRIQGPPPQPRSRDASAECHSKMLPAETPRGRLMLVEHDYAIAMQIKLLLARRYDVVWYNTATLASEKIQFVNPQLIIIDMEMPDMAGDRLCRRIKQNVCYATLPVIMMAPAIMRASYRRAYRAMASLCIVTPYETAALPDAIESLLGNRQLLKEHYLRERLFETIVSPETEDIEFIERVNLLIEENMGNSDFKIDDLIDMLDMSRTAFFSRMRSLKGVSPSSYLLEKRLSRAREMLALTNYNVGEVSEKTGFGDANYFGLLFRRRYGVSPSIFRDNLKDNNAILENF